MVTTTTMSAVIEVKKHIAKCVAQEFCYALENPGDRVMTAVEFQPENGGQFTRNVIVPGIQHCMRLVEENTESRGFNVAPWTVARKQLDTEVRKFLVSQLEHMDEEDFEPGAAWYDEEDTYGFSKDGHSSYPSAYYAGERRLTWLPKTSLLLSGARYFDHEGALEVAITK